MGVDQPMLLPPACLLLDCERDDMTSAGRFSAASQRLANRGQIPNQTKGGNTRLERSRVVQQYQLFVEGESGRRKIQFHAETPDYALCLAGHEADGTRAELWQGATLLARMTKTASNLWELHPCHEGSIGQDMVSGDAHSVSASTPRVRAVRKDEMRADQRAP